MLHSRKKFVAKRSSTKSLLSAPLKKPIKSALAALPSPSPPPGGEGWGEVVRFPGLFLSLQPFSSLPFSIYPKNDLKYLPPEHHMTKRISCCENPADHALLLLGAEAGGEGERQHKNPLKQLRSLLYAA